MTKIINTFINIIKILLLIVCFAGTTYILLHMYTNLNKDPLGADMLEFFGTLLPFILILILFAINLTMKQTKVTENTFFNCATLISLITILFFIYRAKFDTNLILYYKTDYKINFEYFNNNISAIKIMLLGLSLADIILMIEGKLTKKKELIIE